MRGSKRESQITAAPTALKMKAKVGGPGAVDADALARAEQVIADMAGDYLGWAEEDLLNMEDALDKLKAAKTKDRKEHIERIFSSPTMSRDRAAASDMT